MSLLCTVLTSDIASQTTSVTLTWQLCLTLLHLFSLITRERERGGREVGREREKEREREREKGGGGGGGATRIWPE